VAVNPNWPLVSYDWAPRWNCNAGAQPLDQYAEVTARTRGRAGIQRGRQYELDQVRSGVLDMQLANTDGALDPLNTGGPWYGHIMPYQPVRVRTQWPPSINLLTQVQATGGDLGGYSAGTIPGGQQGIDVFSQTDSSGGSIVASGSAWQGSSVFQFAVPSGTASGQAIAYTLQPGAQPSTTYTAQMRVRNITPSTSIQVAAYVSYSNAAGTATRTTGTAVTLTGSTSASWTQVTVTATLGANTAYLSTGLVVTSTTSATCSVQVDGWQLEKNSTASAWVQPGVWYPLYSGFVERYPQSWSMSGTYGTVNTSSVDTFSLLSQRILRDPLTEEIYSRSPRFLFTLSDPQDSQSFTDAIGAYPPAPLAVSKYGPGTLTSGNQITAADPTNGIYTGSTGTVVNVDNPNPGSGVINPATFISLSQAGINGPSNPSLWTRMIAFRYTGPTPTGAAYLWSALDATPGGGSSIRLLIDSNAHLGWALSGPASGLTGTATSFSVADSNWHLVMLTYNGNGLQFFVDGALIGAFVLGSSYAPTGIVGDNVGAFVDPSVGNGTTANYKGDISVVAEFPTELSTSAMSAIYTAWKNSFVGDSSDVRYRRILGWAGFSGPTSIQTGMTTSMGAAATGGQDALSALQAVVDTENGAHYVDRSGAVTFKARSDRYNKLVPIYTLGERTDLGEIPYEDVALDYDPTRLANQVKVTQANSNQVFSAQDSTSIANFFPRQLTRTVNASSPQECQDAANYLLSRYKAPAVRVSALRLHPSANPALMWPVCLSLELGTRIRVMRRPPAPAAAIQADCFVENISWELGDDGDAWVTLQCSPVDLTPYGIFSSFHTTLATSPASGVTSITIANGADNTNPAATQLGQGQHLVLGQNTANQETVTILSVGATSPGWTTAVITLQTATTKSHTAGDVVCEPLPAGVTDPTTWDSSSKLDSMAFAY